MNRIEYLQTGGFPLDTNNLNFLQESFKIMQAFGYFAGNFVIISGCQQTGITIANGVIFINGEVLEFRGGNVGENVIIREESVSGTFEDGSFKPIEVTRYASFGTSTTNYPWANFKRGFPTTEIPAMRDALQAGINTQNTRNDGQDNTLVALLARVEALEKRKSFIPVGLIAFWDQPPSVPLPEGWIPYKVAKGRTLVIVDPDDPDFGEVGIMGGEKSVTLTESQIPAHKHKVFGGNGMNTAKLTNSPNSTAAASGDSPNDNADWNYAVTTTGGEAYAGNSSSVGGSGAHNNMPPYMTIYQIKYTG